MKITSVIAALLCAIAFSACSLSTHESATLPAESLAGTYGVSDPKTGEVKPFLKIEAGDAGDGSYALYEFGKSGWRRPKKAWSDNPTDEPVKPFQKSDLEKAIRHTVTVDVSGVQVPSFALVHVPAGWTDQSGSHAFTTKSGFFALTLLGPVDLVRM
jgi:hypothetical protein